METNLNEAQQIVTKYLHQTSWDTLKSFLRSEIFLDDLDDIPIEVRQDIIASDDLAFAVSDEIREKVIAWRKLCPADADAIIENAHGNTTDTALSEHLALCPFCLEEYETALESTIEKEVEIEKDHEAFLEQLYGILSECLISTDVELSIELEIARGEGTDKVLPPVSPKQIIRMLKNGVPVMLSGKELSLMVRMSHGEMVLSDVIQKDKQTEYTIHVRAENQVIHTAKSQQGKVLIPLEFISKMMEPVPFELVLKVGSEKVTVIRKRG